MHREPDRDRMVMEIEMETLDDEAARKARADRLHKQIADLQSGGDLGEPAAAPGAVGSESPREFIERRMREWPEGSEDDESIGSPEPSDAVPCEPSDVDP